MQISEEIITSSQNKYVCEARGLDDKKRRDECRLFRFDGVKLLCEAIKKGVGPEYILVSEDKYFDVFEKAGNTYGLHRKDINCRIIPVKSSVFEKISREKSPEGVICVAKYIDKFHKFVKINNERNFTSGLVGDSSGKILLLESVRDPLNIGAIIRSAAAFGADRIIMSADCADIYNPKAVRASMGSLFGMCIDIVDDICKAIELLQSCGRRVYAAALRDDSHKLGQTEIRASDCILIGNEGHGLSDKAINTCFSTIFIPMNGEVESLNAGVAAGVLLWEFFGGC